MLASSAAFAQSTPDTLRHAVYFSRGSTTVSSAEKQALTKFIAKVADNSLLEWRLLGFADTVGSTRTNRAICRGRVQAVAKAARATGRAHTPLQKVAVGEVPEADQDKARRVDVLAVRASTDGSFMTGSLGSLLRHLDVDGQTFTVTGSEATTLRTAGGTLLHLPEGAFEAKWPVTLMIKEYRTLREAALAGLTTTAGEALLGTGGMFYLEARDGNGKRVELVQAAELWVPKAQAGDTIYPMQGFEGVRESDGYPDWVPTHTTQMTNLGAASQASQGGVGSGYMWGPAEPQTRRGYEFANTVRNKHESYYNSGVLRAALADFCTWRMPQAPDYPKRQAAVNAIFEQERAAVVLAKQICFRRSQMVSLRGHVETLSLNWFERATAKITGTYRAKQLAVNNSRQRSFKQINKMRLEADSLYTLLSNRVTLADSLYKALPFDTLLNGSDNSTGSQATAWFTGYVPEQYYPMSIRQGGYINLDCYKSFTTIVAQTITNAPHDIPTMYTIVLRDTRTVLPCRPYGRDSVETPRGPKGIAAVLVGVREREDGTFEVAHVPFRFGEGDVKAVFKPVGSTRKAVELALVDLDK